MSHSLWIKINRHICLLLILLLLTAVCSGAAAVEKKEQPALQQGTVLSEQDSFISVAKTEALELFVNTKNSTFMLKTAGGDEWYSNPPDRKDDELARGAWKKNLSSLLYIETSNKEGKMPSKDNSYGGSVQKAGLTVEKIDTGVRFNFNFPDIKITIPLEITLEGNHMKADVDLRYVKNENANLLLTQIHILPFFGAAGNKDLGYMLVPDGSGSLINLNNGKNDAGSYEDMVYGDDQSIGRQPEYTRSPLTTLPVYGMKKGNSAFFGIITEGDAVSVVHADVSGLDTSYNYIYPSFVVRMSDKFSIQDNTGQYRDVTILDNGKGYNGRLSSEYYFLQGENADYNGMAQVFKSYLKELNSNLKASSSADMFLDVYGAVEKKKSVFGIPATVTEVLTTFDRASQMADYFSKNTGANLVMTYRKATADSVSTSGNPSFHPLGELGGQNGLSKLQKQLPDRLFLAYDPVNVKNGFPFFGSSDAVVKNIMNLPVYRYPLNYATGFDRTEFGTGYLFTADEVADRITRYAKSVASSGKKQGAALDYIGRYIYSSYGKEEYSRQDTADAFRNAMKSASEKIPLLTSGGNMYSLPYAKYVTDLTQSSNGYLLTDTDIPFVSLCLNGLISYSGEPINLSSNLQRAVLKTVESGASLHFAFIGRGSSSIKGTELDWLYASDYDAWKETAAELQNKLSDVRAATKSTVIKKHERLANGLICVSYDNGTRIYVNYTDKPLNAGNVTVSAENYKVVSGGES